MPAPFLDGRISPARLPSPPCAGWHLFLHRQYLSAPNVSHRCRLPTLCQTGVAAGKLGEHHRITQTSRLRRMSRRGHAPYALSLVLAGPVARSWGFHTPKGLGCPGASTARTRFPVLGDLAPRERGFFFSAAAVLPPARTSRAVSLYSDRAVLHGVDPMKASEVHSTFCRVRYLAPKSWALLKLRLTTLRPLQKAR